MKIYWIAGEASGDFIGASIIDKLASTDQSIGIGGNKMQEAGLEQLFHMNQINMMGFIEIIPHIFRIQKLINKTVKHIISEKPDLLITIDSPGFTYRIAKRVRKLSPNLKIIHIVAPTVWAYKASRAQKYAALYDYMLTLFDFEPKYFEKFGLACKFIGHPILEQKFYQDKTLARKELSISQNIPVICITPGSRKAEIKRLVPIFLDAIENMLSNYKNLKVIFVLSDKSHRNLIDSMIQKNHNIKYEFCDQSADKLKVFSAADIAIAKSGTNTFEIAASKTPMVIAYKINILSYLLIKLMIKIKYICLINIIADRMIIPEIVQADCNAKNLANQLQNILSNKQCSEQQVLETQRVLESLIPLGEIKPSENAALFIKSVYNEKN